MIDQQELKRLLHYDPVTGIFTWRVSRSRVHVGQVAGCKNSKGYIYIRLNGKKYGAHRLAWLYVHGCWPADQLDHRNTDKSNNAIKNLREATYAENNWNQGLCSTNTSGFKGVSYHKSCKKWRAQIRNGSGPIYLGLFETPELAAAAYARAAEELHGEFARLA